MKHYLAVEDHSYEELESLINLADEFKKNRYQNILKNKTFISMFFNPSLRTKTSFDLAMHELGGHNVTLEPGKSSWGIEVDEGAIMNGEAEEHLKDAVKVLGRYADIIGVRCFPKFQNWQEDKQDKILKNMVKWSEKPIVNMETITHPCQALAMLQGMRQHMGSLKRKKFVLTWGYHPKPLNTAVANSAGVAASIFGLDVVVANPVDYDLDPYYLNLMKEHCQKNGATFSVTHDQEEALKDADYVYLKSWGSLKYFGPNFNKEVHDSNSHWILDNAKMELTNNAFFSHCLPLRRNQLVKDEVVDSAKSIVYDEAENRLHVQKAVISRLLGLK